MTKLLKLSKRSIVPRSFQIEEAADAIAYQLQYAEPHVEAPKYTGKFLDHSGNLTDVPHIHFDSPSVIGGEGRIIHEGGHITPVYAGSDYGSRKSILYPGRELWDTSGKSLGILHPEDLDDLRMRVGMSKKPRQLSEAVSGPMLSVTARDNDGPGYLDAFRQLRRRLFEQGHPHASFVEDLIHEPFAATWYEQRYAPGRPSPNLNLYNPFFSGRVLHAPSTQVINLMNRDGERNFISSIRPSTVSPHDFELVHPFLQSLPDELRIERELSDKYGYVHPSIAALSDINWNGRQFSENTSSDAIGHFQVMADRLDEGGHQHEAEQARRAANHLHWLHYHKPLQGFESLPDPRR